MKKLTLLLFALISSIGMAWAQETNLALNAEVSFASESGTASQNGTILSSIVDGNEGTSWQSGNNPTVAIIFKLTAEASFNKVSIKYPNDRWATGFSLYTSNDEGNTWEKIDDFTDTNNTNSHTFEATFTTKTTKYVKFVTTSSQINVPDDAWGIQISELRLYSVSLGSFSLTPSFAQTGAATDFTGIALDTSNKTITSGITYTLNGESITSLDGLVMNAGTNVIAATFNNVTMNSTIYGVSPISSYTKEMEDDITLFKGNDDANSKLKINENQWDGGCKPEKITFANGNTAFSAKELIKFYLAPVTAGDPSYTGYTKLHLDIFSINDHANAVINIEGINASITQDIYGGQWNSVDINISGKTDALTYIWIQYYEKEVSSSTDAILVDNIYYSKAEPVIPFNITETGVVTGNVTSSNVATINACTSAVINLTTAIVEDDIIITPTNVNAIVMVSGTERTPSQTVDAQNLVVYDGVYYRAASGKVITLTDNNLYQPNYNLTGNAWIDAKTDGVVYTRSIPANAWVTTALPCETPIPAGINAYRPSSVNDNTITFTKYTGNTMGATTGFILHNTTNEIIDLVSYNGKIDLNLTNPAGSAIGESNVIVHPNMTIIEADGTQFALQTNELKRFNTGAKIGAFRVYFTGLSSAYARAIFLDGETTKIGSINANGEISVEDGIIYNLAGQRVQNPTKGIYIINGKKVVIK